MNVSDKIPKGGERGVKESILKGYGQDNGEKWTRQYLMKKKKAWHFVEKLRGRPVGGKEGKLRGNATTQGEGSRIIINKNQGRHMTSRV